MNRRQLLGAHILLLGAASLFGGREGRTQAPPKRVIWLGASEEGQMRIRGGFASQNLVDGRDVALAFEAIRNSSKEAAEAQADELVRRRPDVIISVANWTIDLLKRRTQRIPIVFYNVGFDPSRLGWVETLRRPGANMTGTTNMGDQWMTKQWQLLKEVRPSMKRGGLCWWKEEMATEWAIEAALGLEPSQRIVREVLDRIEVQLGIEIVDVKLSLGATDREFAEAMRKNRPEALALNSQTDSFIAFARAARIPTCGHRFESVRRGLLMAVSWDWLEGETQAVAMAARILRGESPATMPVYRNTRYFVAVNLATARATGIEIPASILLRADEIVR